MLSKEFILAELRKFAISLAAAVVIASFVLLLRPRNEMADFLYNLPWVGMALGLGLIMLFLGAATVLLSLLRRAVSRNTRINVSVEKAGWHDRERKIMGLDANKMTASRVFEIMVSGSELERDTVQEAVINGSIEINRAQLRTLVLSAIKHDFYPGREFDEEEKSIAWTRTWLISILAIVADDDQETHSVLRQYLQPDYEPNPWVRYWLLYGLIRTNVSDLQEIAQSVTDDPVPLVSMVGVALLARARDAEARKKILAGLDDQDSNLQWGTLRALRLVVLQDNWKPIRDKLCAIIEAGEFNNTTFDAIVALSHISPGTGPAEEATDSLIKFVFRVRLDPVRDGERVKAIAALGKLQTEKASSILLEELRADNPAIGREAARALEKVLGVRRATSTIVETAGRVGQERLPDYAYALRWMQDREQVLEELEALMLAGSAVHQETARRLLSEMGGSVAIQKLQVRRNALNQYGEMLKSTEDAVRMSFEASIHQARSGFRWATTMDWIVFAVGIFLLVVSAILVLMSSGNLDNWVGVAVTGGGGVLGILYGTLIAKPRQKIQNAVDHLMHLQVVFLAYVRQLHQVDQAYTRLLLEEAAPTVAQVGDFSKMIDNTMAAAVQQLDHARNATPVEDAPVIPGG